VIDFSPPELADKKEIHGVMCWLAVYEELNVENTAILSFLAAETGLSSDLSVHECLNSLVQRKFAVRRGVGGRLYSIRPDVVREFVVRDWLTQRRDAGYEATPAAKHLIELLLPNNAQTGIPNAQQLLKSIATLEFSERLQGHEIDLLSPIVERLTHAAANGTLRDQQMVMGYLHHIAFARVPNVLDVIRIIKQTQREPFQLANPLFGKTEVTHDKIVADLTMR
jgi:hypothetical protein